MRLFDLLVGNTSAVDLNKATKELEWMLLPGEKIGACFKTVRDMIVFTDKRLILVDKQGLTGSKQAWRSVPYRSVSSFSCENAGTFDVDSEILLWLRGEPGPIQIKVSRAVDIKTVYRALSAAILDA